MSATSMHHDNVDAVSAFVHDAPQTKVALPCASINNDCCSCSLSPPPSRPELNLAHKVISRLLRESLNSNGDLYKSRVPLA